LIKTQETGEVTMIQIEKVTRDGDPQIFIKYSRRDLVELISTYFDMLAECKRVQVDLETDSREYYFNDCGLFWQLDDGTTGSIDIWGLNGKRPAANRIAKLYENGHGTYTGFFGKGIEPKQNEKYGDWEVEL
jgi:hypothetical protein